MVLWWASDSPPPSLRLPLPPPLLLHLVFLPFPSSSLLFALCALSSFSFTQLVFFYSFIFLLQRPRPLFSSAFSSISQSPFLLLFLTVPPSRPFFSFFLLHSTLFFSLSHHPRLFSLTLFLKLASSLHTFLFFFFVLFLLLLSYLHLLFSLS